MAEQDPFDHLNDNHKEQVKSYLRFARSQLSEHTKEIDATFDETKDMRILEDMYSSDDVTNIIDGLRDVVKSNVSSELEKSSSQTALLLRQLFLQAEGQGVSLKVDASSLEDSKLLAGLKKIDLREDKHTESGPKKLGALSGAPVDVKLVTKIKDLEEQNQRLTDRASKIMAQCQAALKEVSGLKEEREALEKKVADANHDLAALKGDNTAAVQMNELNSLRAQLAAKEKEKNDAVNAVKKELADLNDTLNSKVNSSAQFQTLQKMVKTKNQQLKEARDKIKELEDAAAAK